MTGALETVIRKPARHLMRLRSLFIPSTLNETKNHQQTGTLGASVPPRLIKVIRQSRTYVLLRLRRIKRTLLGTRESITIARAETRDLLRLLRQSGIPVEEISPAIPPLARCLAQRQVMYSNILALMGVSGYLVLVGFWYIIPIALIQLQFPIIVIFLPFIMIVTTIYLRTDDDYRRILKYATGVRPFVLKYMWIYMLAIYLIFFIIYRGEIDIIIKNIYEINIYEWLIVTSQGTLFVLYVVLVYWLARIILRWRAPELTLVRALADAFEIVVAASPANWRSISLRSKAAHCIHKAAVALEGPIARKFAASAGFSDAAAIHRRFEMAGAALRSKVAWLATPRADTKSFLARTLADELLIAATGDLDRLEYAEIGQAQIVTISWIARLRATASWAIFGFGPAIFVVVSRTVGWITDPATTAILVQFAALCFFAAVLSAVDPSGYKDRLSSVTGTGAALFGWRKAGNKRLRGV